MNTDKLIAMANQIATFFQSYPEAEASRAIQEHIRAFWTPRMCAAIRADAGNAALDPLVAESLRSWR